MSQSKNTLAGEQASTNHTAPAKNIVDTAIGAGNFTTLAAGFKAAGLMGTLAGKGPFTVFAPTDEAFKKLPAGAMDALLKDTAKLKAVLNYHVIAGHVTARDMKSGDRVFLYHSMGHAAVVGLADVVGDGRNDNNNPKLAVADFRFRGHIDPPVTLREIKESGLFDDWALIRQSRLSTMEAPAEFVKWIKSKRPGSKI